MQNYEKEYRKLNRAQRQAVDTIEGPVLVVAGPGTGKTQLLSMRIANILKSTDAPAGSILGLTFTNKAAANMRERLIHLIGPEAHAVEIKTFHSFAADIMSENPDYFWSGAPLVSAPDAVTLSIIEDILATLPLNNPLAIRYSGSYTAINDVQEGLKLTKEAGLTPAKLRALISANIAYIDLIEKDFVAILAPPLRYAKLRELQRAVSKLPRQKIDTLLTPLMPLDTVLQNSLAFAVQQDETAHKTTHTSAWKRRWVQSIGGQRAMHDERRRNIWWLNLADVYQQYRDEMSQRGYYDYADMIVEVISQLESSAELRATVQEKFLYVLIDEFQDSNAAQLRLAHLVADNALVSDEPNLMAVGDDDQSIFKFNGAELNNMLSFRASYPSARVIVLTENYRSTQAVLSTAETIIKQANDRLVTRDPSLSKTLIAKNPPSVKGAIVHQIYPTPEHQYALVAREIAKLYQKKTGQSIAVLARNHASLRAFAAALLRQQVPVRYEQQQNIFDNEAVKQILLIVRTVEAIGEGNQALTNEYMAQLVKHPMWNIKPTVLWKLAVSNYNKPAWLESLLKHPDSSLKHIAQWLLWLSQEASYQPVFVVLEYVIGLLPGEYMSSPIKKYYVDRQRTSNAYLQTLSALHRLRSLVNEFAKNNPASLADLIEFVRLNQTNARVITDESWFVSGDNAVDLLTVHKAKGLEFDIIYLIDAVESVWQPRHSGRKPPANLPLQPYGEDFDDYVRLMYVAVTRAKHTLKISSYASDDNNEPILATPLIQTLPRSEVSHIALKDTLAALEQAAHWPRLETNAEQQLLAPRLENYQLSITHLLHFLDVTSGGPQNYFEHNLLRLPEAKSAAQAYGIALHETMETAQKLVNNDKFTMSKVLDAFSTNLRNEYLPKDQHERYLRHGHDVLGKLFQQHHYTLQKGSFSEQHFQNVQVGEARLGGTIDRLDLSDKHITIVDYKTGKPLSSFYTRDKAKQVKAWRHRLQLIFYTLLVKNSRRFPQLNTAEAQMVYVEAESDSKLVHPYQASEHELNELATIIQAVWHHIQDLSFPSTDHYPAGLTGIEKFIDDLKEKRV